MNVKGQGALEYLLLIGGAIVVAVVVVTLLLNLGSTGGANAGSSSMGSIGAQYAATAGNSPPTCNDVTPSTTAANADNWIFNNNTKECWAISGSYPNCTATRGVTAAGVVITTDDTCGAGSQDQIVAAGTGHTANNHNI
ncbi:MAG TPA: class III signal peptide-containing protein [archaeon]|nr:class III signal peptide-containing protein [archaeon]